MTLINSKKNNFIPSLVSIYPEGKKITKSSTFIGIDLGTSTTVVSSISAPTKENLKTEPFQLEQPTEFGGIVSHELVNSVLVWKNNNHLRISG
ncbi:MAG: hypothetical protein LBR11_10765 [Deltaproteobacteria bacterium]|jgi:molecular chaperone DnaK (HSP70)|nr:hypothetical protein [Deltaproteobacteria bacterium]